MISFLTGTHERVAIEMLRAIGDPYTHGLWLVLMLRIAKERVGW